jgi:hypothetical protein
MGVVQEAIADGVGQGGVGEVVVPLGGRQLAGDDGGAVAVAVLEDLQHVAAFLVGDRRQAPVVDQEDVDAGELAEQADVGAVGAGEREVVKEPRGAAVVGAEAFAAGVGGESAGDEALPRASRNSNILRSFLARLSSITAGTPYSASR